MKTISKAQIAKIRSLMKRADMIEDEKQIIHFVTNSRTTNIDKLTRSEAVQMIARLLELADARRVVMPCFSKLHGQRYLIVSLARQAGIIYGNSDADDKINVAKLNLFIRENGVVKKNLDTLTYTEAVKVRRQLEAILKDMEQEREKHQAEAAVMGLLADLNLVVA